MDYIRILGLILDIGEEMIRSGAETHRVEDSLYRLCAAYRFEKCNIWVVPSNIQATATTPNGDTHTQIRHIRSAGMDFECLDRLNALSRRTCADTPDADALERRLKTVLDEKPLPGWVLYLAGLLAGTGFGVFFNCDFMDVLVAAGASLLVTLMVRTIGKLEPNPLIFNFLTSFAAELFILLAVHFGIGDHSGYITIGVIMLLISGLGATNGVRDLAHLDTLSGVMNISVALMGAIGIALGIALPMVILRGWDSGEIMVLNSNVIISLMASAVAGVGFALWFRVRGKKIIFCAIGSLLTWACYLGIFHFYPGTFVATLAASIAGAFYAQIMARVHKAPATIFQTVSVIPLIPGATLYYMMSGFVTGRMDFALNQGGTFIMTCMGIVLGFMAVEVIGKYIFPHPHPAAVIQLGRQESEDSVKKE